MKKSEFTIKNVTNIDSSLLSKLYSLIKDCHDYVPYYSETPDSAFIQIIALCNDRLVGFLGLLEQDSYYELSACVAPIHRNHGLFKQMLSKASDIFNDLDISKPILCPVPKDYLSASCIGDAIFTEYLLSLNPSDYGIIKDPIDENYEFEFDDDELSYYMYEIDGEEPIALLNLACESSYTNIYGVFVDENLRGQGIGSILMKHFLYDYFSNNLDISINSLVLNVTSNNLPAFSLYKKCGFTEVSHIDYYNIISN